MVNKLSTKKAHDLFKRDDWFQPMLFFSEHKATELSIDMVKEYLDSKNLKYEICDEPYNDDNYRIDISPTNQYDLKSIYKHTGTHFSTDHVYNKVRSVVYMDNPPHYSDEIIISIGHNDGLLVDESTWESWIKNRFNTEAVQEAREFKLGLLLEKDINENMSEEFSFHLIRHIINFNKEFNNPFVKNVYDFYSRKGYITKKQLEPLKEIIYWNKGCLY